jgi:hypothetical protein
VAIMDFRCTLGHADEMTCIGFVRRGRGAAEALGVACGS